MRREAFFSGDSPYEVMVRSNLLLHTEVAGLVKARLRPLLATRPAGAGIEVLDLACGVPITMTAVMEEFVDYEFRYTGVDINPDQVEKARGLPFPENVSARIEEGSAWDLSHLDSPAPYDLVFAGLNWHHGTPEELWFLAVQVRELLAAGGRLINHDCYRPGDTSYLRRPRSVIENGEAVSLDLVDAELLASAGVPDFGLAEQPAEAGRPEWKVDLIKRLEEGYREGGGDDAGAEIVAGHSWARDFPVSLDEIRLILGEAGFDVEVDGFSGVTGSMAPYLAVVTAL